MAATTVYGLRAGEKLLKMWSTLLNETPASALSRLARASDSMLSSIATLRLLAGAGFGALAGITSGLVGVTRAELAPSTASCCARDDVEA